MIIKLTTRTMRVKAGYDWLRHQVGVSRERTSLNPLIADDSAFHLLGWGETHEEAKAMSMRTLRRKGVNESDIV